LISLASNEWLKEELSVVPTIYWPSTATTASANDGVLYVSLADGKTNQGWQDRELNIVCIHD
jgi:hypothetical protein